MAKHKLGQKLPPPRNVHRDDGFSQTVHFSVKELPQIKDWEVTGKYQIVLNVTQKSDEVKEFGTNKGMRSARFSIDKVTAYTEPIK